MQHTNGNRRWRASLAVGVGLATVTATPTGGAIAQEAPPVQYVYAAPTPRHWDPLTDEKWAFEQGQVILTERGTNPGPPRRPFEYAIVEHGPELASISLSAEVRIDEPVEFSNRDVILVWNYQSPTRFYYAHLSQDNTIYPHNGIFVVDNADRRRIDDQWWGGAATPPAITDTAWHDARVDYDAGTGEIAVHVDGQAEPLMTATDTTFSGGRVGFGSFDNYGRTRHFSVTGTTAPTP
jgi:hypothetical protein